MFSLKLRHNAKLSASISQCRQASALVWGRRGHFFVGWVCVLFQQRQYTRESQNAEAAWSRIKGRRQRCVSHSLLLLAGLRCYEPAAECVHPCTCCAEYSENQPTRKLMQAAGKKEGDANIFPSESAHSFHGVLASICSLAIHTFAYLQIKMLGRK